jgi:LacI family transcriptional regulator
LKDVAKRAGVDPSLVSRIVNDDPRAASTPETRQRVLDAVEALGYRASVAARGLRMARTMTVGLVLPDLSNPMYASIVRGVQARARALGYGVVLGSQTDEDPDVEVSGLLRDGRVDGLLIASGTADDDYLRRAAADGLGPLVLVNRRVSGVDASVTVDDAAGAELVVAHLAELGHQSITALVGPVGIDTTIRRLEGFHAACDARGIEAVEVETGSWTAQAGYAAALGALTGPARPTAVFATTFAIGAGTLRAAREAGIDVPRDLSVITLHDADWAEYLSPPLTAVAMPSERMGADAMSLLDRLIGGGAPEHLVVADRPVLRRRGSTGAPPASGP